MEGQGGNDRLSQWAGMVECVCVCGGGGGGTGLIVLATVTEVDDYVNTNP